MQQNYEKISKLPDVPPCNRRVCGLVAEGERCGGRTAETVPFLCAKIFIQRKPRFSVINSTAFSSMFCRQKRSPAKHLKISRCIYSKKYVWDILNYLRHISNYLPCIFNLLRELFYHMKKIFFSCGKIFFTGDLFRKPPLFTDFLAEPFSVCIVIALFSVYIHLRVFYDF